MTLGWPSSSARSSPPSSLAWVVRTVTSKLLALAVVAAVAVVVWSQRAALQDCADRVGATLAAGSVDDTTCAFFGREVTVTSPLG